MEMITVLLTGAGAPGAPSIIKCLRKNGEREIRIIGVDMNMLATGRSLVDVFYTVPAAKDEAFIDSILDICKKEKVKIVIPIVTKELEKFSERKEEFLSIGVKVSVMQPENLHVSNNKGLLLNSMKSIGLPTPEFRIARSVVEIERAMKELGYPEKPLVIKPTEGNGSRGTRIIDERISKYDLFFNQKPNSVYISYSELIQTLKACASIPEMMVMEYLPGVEYSVDVLAENGKICEIVCRKGMEVINSIMVGSVIEQNPKVLAICRKVTEQLKLDGNIGFDLKENAEGEPMVMEINPRLTAGVVACAVAGVNFPYLQIKRLLGEPSEKERIHEGVVMQRRYNEIYFDEKGIEINW